MYGIVRVLKGSVNLVSSSIGADCDMTIGAAPDPQVRYRWAFTIPAKCKQAAKISSVSAHAEEDEVRRPRPLRAWLWPPGRRADPNLYGRPSISNLQRT